MTTTKETGLGWTTLSVDNSAGSVNAIKNDVTNFQFATPRAIQDITGVDKSAMERLHLLADFSITLNGVFDDASNLAHDTFKNLANQRTVTLVISGQTLANECLFTDFAYTRPQSGELTWSAPGVLADGTLPAWT
jgi:hypothetical protein